MASSPSKLRRTSPTPSAPATPSRIPVRIGNLGTTPSRPSFASPTKASIAKHNPQLLRPSAGPQTSNPGSPSRGSASLPQDHVEEQHELEVAATIQSTTTENVSQFEPPQVEPRAQNTAQKHPATPLKDMASSQSLSTKAIGGRLATAPRRTPKTSIDNTRTIQGADLAMAELVPFEADHPDPFRRTGLRRSPLAPQTTAAVEPEPAASFNPVEASLPQVPPTPPRPDILPASTTPTESPVLRVLPQIQNPQHPPPSRSPILTTQNLAPPTVQSTRTMAHQTQTALHSTPAGSPMLPVLRTAPLTSQAAGDQEPAQMPALKQRRTPEPVAVALPEDLYSTPSKRPRKRQREERPTSVMKPLPVQSDGREILRQPAASTLSHTAAQHTERMPVGYPSRPVDAIDPHAEKTRQKGELLAELERLQLDLAIAEKENERLRTIHQSSTQAGIELENGDEVLDLLLRVHTASTSSKVSGTTSNVFDKMNLFLPFGGKRKRSKPTKLIGPSALPSHEPLPQPDPLPFLQVFSALTYSSVTTLLSPTPDSSDSSAGLGSTLLRSHDITATDSSGLFAARINMIVDTATLNIISLSIPSLSPDSEAELGSWVRDRADGDGVLGKDLSSICWAMGSWTKVASKRAKFWQQIASEVGAPHERAKMIEAVKVQRTRKRGPRTNELELNEGDELAEVVESDSSVKKSTRKQMLPLMGKREMLIAGDGIDLMISWIIDFDWTGEAISKISAIARVPRNWKDEDDRNSLSQVPESFDRLVRSSGPLQAVRTMVALLMS